MSGRKRPWLAAVLAFLYPGLGHVYLRSWLRAGAWFGLALVTAALILPESVTSAAETGGLGAMLAASQSLPFDVLAPLLLVRGLNVVDAYLTGRRVNRERVAAAAVAEGSCPECGRELDADLDFCPWCTTRLDADEEAASGDVR